ncbi:hypothetical protein D3C76_1191510 [compost metagenome]
MEVAFDLVCHELQAHSLDLLRSNAIPSGHGHDIKQLVDVMLILCPITLADKPAEKCLVITRAQLLP